tara:strand:+ start:441 stop:1769 length:1329 start_codon:yes stop_codon:yes gene_type:complete
MDLYKKVKKYIIDNKIFSIEKDKVILAISGGADSVCLMHVLIRIGVNFELAHCNFKLRDDESEADEKFVKKLSRSFGLKLYCYSFDTNSYAINNKISLQMAARELRYNWFDKILLDNNIDYIVTAHHLDDSIETFFINLIRGSGIKGLIGIENKLNNIIRPFLCCTRNDIDDYLRKNNIKYREDSSNNSLKYMRNNIRKRLIPLLEEFNPNIRHTISTDMKVLKDSFAVFSEYIDVVRSHIVSEKEGLVLIDICKLKTLNPMSIYLFELLKPYKFHQIESIISAIDTQSGKIFYSSNYKLLIDRNKIFISIRNEKDNHLEKKISVSDKIISSPFRISFTVSTENSISNNLNIAHLDFEKLKFPLILRKWKDGDKFIPLGMRNFKKLSDFFIDQKFSIFQKKNQWLLCSSNDIIWVIGKRIDDRYKVNLNTKKLYIAEIYNNY